MEEILDQEIDYYRREYEAGMITFEEYQQGVCDSYLWSEEEYLGEV